MAGSASSHIHHSERHLNGWSGCGSATLCIIVGIQGMGAAMLVSRLAVVLAIIVSFAAFTSRIVNRDVDRFEVGSIDQIKTGPTRSALCHAGTRRACP